MSYSVSPWVWTSGRTRGLNRAVDRSNPNKPPDRESPLHSLAERAPMMMWVSSADAGALLLNQSWRAFRGVGPQDELPDGWAHAVHAEDLTTALARFVEAHERRISFDADYRVRRADGEWRWVRDHGTPWFDADGAFMG